MSRIIKASVNALLLGSLVSSIPAMAEETQTAQAAPQAVADAKTIEMVFVLDTTGSMGGLIEGAKTKIWRIVNDAMQDRKNQGARVKVGLVAYRDRGDDYVTQVTQLSDNLDSVYSKLLAFEANGGGDTPEDVNTALKVGVQNVGWSRASEMSNDKSLSQILFLVGDAPPKPYKNTVPVQQMAKLAKEKGITVNSIRVGSDSQTERVWKQVAQYGGGEYFSIAQDGGVRAIETPYDDDLAKLGDQMDSDFIAYGSAEERKDVAAESSMAVSAIKAAPAPAKADRALNKSINKSAYNKKDIVQAVENKEVSLKAIKSEELPVEMQSMSESEREAFVDRKIAARKETKAKIEALSKQRAAYLAEKEKAGDGFDATVSKTLQKQIK